jgi:hypothetical protein
MSIRAYGAILLAILARPVYAQMEPPSFAARGSQTRGGPTQALRNDTEIPPSGSDAKQKNISAEERDQLDFLRSLGGLPVEYRADLMLSALEVQPKWLKSEKVQGLLEDLYAAASQAVHGYMLTLAVENSGEDTVEGRLSVDAQQDLDALSIRLRVMKLLGQVKPRMTYDLLSETKPVPPAADCNSALAATVSDFYTVFLAQQTNSRKSTGISSEETKDLLLGHISSLSAPQGLAPLAALLTSLPTDGDDLNEFATAYTAAEYRLTASDRDLGVMVNNEKLSENVDQFATRLQQQRIDPQNLLQGLRAFLIGSTRARCQNSLVRPAALLLAYNSVVAHHGIQDRAILLKDTDLNSDQTLGAPIVHGSDPPATADPYVRALGYQQRTSSPREISQWQTASADLLSFTEHLNDDQGCGTCLFYEKFLLYYMLFDGSPGGASKIAAFRSATQFMANTPVKQTDPTVWIAQMKVLINYSRYADDKQLEKIRAVRALGVIPVRVPVSEGKVIIEEMLNSQDPVMQDYARYERLFHPLYELPPY